jgi:hypothetical protein
VSQRGNAPAPPTQPEALRAYLARILGWERTEAIWYGVRSIELSITHRAALVLLGETNMVPIALALHRLTLGADRPFIVIDSRRVGIPATVRAPMSYKSGVAAVRDARGGTLCMHYRRRPHDFEAAVAMLRDPSTDVQLVVCADAFQATHPFLVRPVPLLVPPLTARAHELPRIVDAYARDAIEALGADRSHFTTADRRWVLDRDPRSLAEIETATLRLVALRQAGTVNGAVKRLGMAHVSFTRWLARRPGVRIGKGGK